MTAMDGPESKTNEKQAFSWLPWTQAYALISLQLSRACRPQIQGKTMSSVQAERVGMAAPALDPAEC